MRNPQFDKLQKLLAANDLAGAERLCRLAIKKNRNDASMIGVLGAVLLRSGRVDEAEKHIRKAMQLAPKFAKPHEDLALLHMRRKEFSKAEAHFRIAAELQPDMASAWFGLVRALKNQGDLVEALRICGGIMASNPDNLNAIRLMAEIEAARHKYQKAIELYRRAAEIAPRDSKIRFSLADYLLMIGSPEEALAAFDAGLLQDPDSPRGRSGRLFALRNLGRTGEVIEGRLECIDRGINVSESWWSLSSLRTYSFSDDDIDRMKALRQSASLSNVDAAFLDFAIGKAMDDREQYDDAWAAYVSGNEGRRRAVHYDAAEHKARVDAIIEATDVETVTRTAGGQAHSVTPIFVIGLPRSGSTLVEQILASHSSVEATTELPYMTGLGERNTPAEADEAMLMKIGDHYLQAAVKHFTKGRPYFTDKQPENYLYAGLIALSLPQAKIIDVRRNPLDTCIGNFRQWFGQGKEFSYDLDELANHYLQYHRLMQHWNDVMPAHILEICYEELVDDTERQIRRMLKYCGLPWEAACLDFHENKRVITTASSEQVRQPIYKGAVGFWKNYDHHLDGLKESLASVLD